ncbi:MAG: hypothetical protein Q4G33_12485, partial [bacterium]|nr:hypothetical protein [bacterium]
MKIKILSAVLVFSILCGVMPGVSAQNNASDKDLDSIRAEMAEEANAEGIDLGSLSVPYDFDPDATQEPEEDIEENIHTETITGDVELQEESEILLDESEVSLFSEEEDYSNLWKSLFSDYFGDDYLAPYKGNKDGQHVTGNTNRLVIEETDLSLPGKNGLDLNIRRKHDNQYYNHVYSRIKYDTKSDIYIDRYGYGFTDSSTNKNIYVLFTNEDDFYIYMKNGITISSLPTPYDNKKINGTYVNLYLFENIYYKKSNTGITLTYNSSMREIRDTETVTKKYDLEDRKLLPKDNFLGDGWDLILPSVSLHRYLYETDKDDYTKIYKGDYIGAFRDIEGNVFSFEGYDKYKRYKDSDPTYTSSFHCDNNKYF